MVSPSCWLVEIDMSRPNPGEHGQVFEACERRLVGDALQFTRLITFPKENVFATLFILEHYVISIRKSAGTHTWPGSIVSTFDHHYL